MHARRLLNVHPCHINVRLSFRFMKGGGIFRFMGRRNPCSSDLPSASCSGSFTAVQQQLQPCISTFQSLYGFERLQTR